MPNSGQVAALSADSAKDVPQNGEMDQKPRSQYNHLFLYEEFQDAAICFSRAGFMQIISANNAGQICVCMDDAKFIEN